MFTHIHIGAGALGLGLVVPSLRSDQVFSIVVNRRSEGSLSRSVCLSENLQYSLSGGTKDKVTIDRFVYQDELVQLFKSQIDTNKHCDLRDKVVLITSAVKEGLKFESYKKFITELLLFSSKHARSTVFSLCENSITTFEFYNNLKGLNYISLNDVKHADDKIILAESLVDRVCANPTLDNGLVAVDVEAEFDWYLEEECIPETIKGLVKFASKDWIIKEKLKKLTLLNLAHTLISIWAVEADEVLLNTFLSRPGSKTILHNIHVELIEILLVGDHDYDEAELIQYKNSIAKRFASRPDKVSRILSRFSSSENIFRFYEDVWVKGLRQIDDFDVEIFERFPYVAMSMFKMIKLIANDKYALVE